MTHETDRSPNGNHIPGLPDSPTPVSEAIADIRESEAAYERGEGEDVGGVLDDIERRLKIPRVGPQGNENRA